MRTYGTARRMKNGKWRIEAEPHVVIKLKRVFGRVSRKHQGRIFLQDTLEVCRDLRWFMDRYPLDVDPRDYLEERARKHAEDEQAFADLLSGRIDPQPFALAIDPRRYQRVAADLWLRAGGLLVADDVGLGKTVTAIAGLTDPRTRPALVVTLTHLPHQWQRELERFAPQLRTHVIKNGTPYDVTRRGRTSRQLDLIDPDFPDVLICNYHKLAGWAEALAPVIKSVVFDEIQELRRSKSGKDNERTAKYAAAEHIAHNAEYRLGLSATPIYNYGSEMFNVLEILRPGALGTWSEFREEWCTVGYADKARVKEPAAFGTYLREHGLMIRRTRQDVGRELPDLTKVPHYVDSDTKVLDEVSDAAAELAKIILEQGAAPLQKRQAAGELDWRLRQATGIAKAPYVAEFVRLLVESGEKVVLYGWHREVYSLWMERLADLNPVLYTGTESAAQKERAVTRFVTREAKVLVMSLRSGAGLDGLQGKCRTVVFGELDWSPGVHEQCEGRVHRDGQSDPVVAYYLISDTGSDPVIADVLGVKRAQIEGVRNPEGGLVAQLDVGGDRMKSLAARYLKDRGLPVPEAPAPQEQEARHG
ncbi:MAG: DEAD/DEAH box helicase [Myxococcota bacterium]